MKVLIACEESQRVCVEFRKLGHEAYSCDIQECSGGHPEWHIQGDVLPYIDGNCIVTTMDGVEHRIDGTWDLLIAHPPCTYLSNAGARHLWKGHVLNQERYAKGLYAKNFFLKFLSADCPKICVENPVPSRVYELPKYTQTIQPYEYGHPYSKRTCLWLKNLPMLQPTDIVEPVGTWCPSGSYSHKHDVKHKGIFTKDRARNRSKTFLGIAKAMAEQWGGKIMVGIDISKWNGGIDFNKVKSAGVKFVIIRAGFGVNGIDRLFKANYKAAKEAGLKIGVYWYSYAKTKAELQNEISAFLNTIKGMHFEMPIYWDIEEKWGINNINYVIPTVCTALENAGYFAGYYTSASVNASVSDENKKRFTSWIAHWGKKAGAYKPMHQYSNTGEISGINGDVDLDFCSTDFPAIIAEKKLNNTAITASDSRIQEAIDKINAGVNILENMKEV